MRRSKKKSSDPALDEALKYWRECNSSPNTWASFEALQFAHELVIRVQVGVLYYKGTSSEWKEIAFKTRKFSTDEAGNVRYSDHAEL